MTHQQPNPPGDADSSSPPQPDGPPHHFQPGGEFGQQPPQPTGFDVAPVGAGRKALIIAVVGAVALLMLITAAYAVYDGYIKEDSGVAACKAMRDGKNPDGSEITDEYSKAPEAEYRKLREVFADSRHEDIRMHGTAFVDLVWQISQTSNEGLDDALDHSAPLESHMLRLAAACADQGVIVN
ncbi:proline-rich domain-containing protein [Micromonospora peucetia]|uniref:proline-rich domain-containing protein n=1 Tax=Micromonospora peucetia TaxID=47871 RepID=UPI00332FDFC6